MSSGNRGDDNGTAVAARLGSALTRWCPPPQSLMLRDAHLTRRFGMAVVPQRSAVDSEDKGIMLLDAELPTVSLALAPTWRALTGARTG